MFKLRKTSWQGCYYSNCDTYISTLTHKGARLRYVMSSRSAIYVLLAVAATSAVIKTRWQVLVAVRLWALTGHRVNLAPLASATGIPSLFSSSYIPHGPQEGLLDG